MRNLTATLTVVCDAPDEAFEREGECCYYEDDNCEYFIDHWWSSLKETTQCTD